MGQHDKSPISPVRGIDSAALPQAAAFFNVSEFFNSFTQVMTEFSVQYSTSLSDTRHLQNQLQTSNYLQNSSHYVIHMICQFQQGTITLCVDYIHPVQAMITHYCLYLSGTNDGQSTLPILITAVIAVNHSHDFTLCSQLFCIISAVQNLHFRGN